MAYPDLTQFWMLFTGGIGVDYNALCTTPGVASGLVAGSNPPYGIANFLQMYPKFCGAAIPVTATATAGSIQLEAVFPASLAGMGQLAIGAAVLEGTTILATGSDANGTTAVLSSPATATGPIQLLTFPSALVPPGVIEAFIQMANTSLQQARWRSQWSFAMALYVAHFLTLYAQTDSATSGALSGLAQGVTTAQSAGPVSVSLQPLPGQEKSGTWALTQYGLQLITLSRAVGMGPIYVR